MIFGLLPQSQRSQFVNFVHARNSIVPNTIYWTSQMVPYNFLVKLWTLKLLEKIAYGRGLRDVFSDYVKLSVTLWARHYIVLLFHLCVL